jgi:hypothetical protein
MAELLVDVLDKLCAYCHTDDDYDEGCRGCPAGRLVFKCRDYILSAVEKDKYYAWLEGRRELHGQPVPPEEVDMWRRLSEESRAESDTLRAMKAAVRDLTPHPFFYGFGEHGRPESLSRLTKLARRLRRQRNRRRYPQ